MLESPVSIISCVLGAALCKGGTRPAHPFDAKNDVARGRAVSGMKRANTWQANLLVAFSLIGWGCAGSEQAIRFKGVNETVPGTTFHTPESKGGVTEAEILAKFSAPVESQYRVGPGDELMVEAWDRPDLSAKHVVGPDGYITLPVAGSLQVSGLTRDHLTRNVAKAYRRYFLDLHTTVRIDRYVHNRVMVLGRVANPGVVQFDTPPTLLEAIARSGGLPVGGAGSEKAALTRCAVFRGTDRVVWLNLRSILTGANLAMNIRLQPDDLVYIPDADDQLVYVLGSVHHPGAFQLTPGMSLLDALAKAGGPNEDANPDHIQIVRPTANLNREFSLAQLLRPEPGLIVTLEEGDILYVPDSGMAKVGYVLKSLAPLGNLLFFGALLASL